VFGHEILGILFFIETRCSGIETRCSGQKRVVRDRNALFGDRNALFGTETALQLYSGIACAIYQILVMSQVRHLEVNCDHCHQTPIVGTRYKCSTCPNFDLCDRCMDTHDFFPGVVNHPTDHVFYRIATPKPYLIFGNLSNHIASGVACRKCNCYPITGYAVASLPRDLGP
jgi:hypothetical protein